MLNIHYDGLYRLPFSKNDNFNGWLEVTELCNSNCPGCYRGCDRPGRKGAHRPLKELKDEVLELQRIRNCSMISIAGGEPLLHPGLDELVWFIAEQKLKPVILTNGILLGEERLRKLVKSGLTGVMVRVDTLQQPGKYKREADLQGVREKFAELCDRAGVYLTFTTCVEQGNLADMPLLLDWAEKNAHRVGQMLLILKRSLRFEPDGDDHEESFVWPEELAGLLAGKVPGFSFAAYLGSDSRAREAKWLQAYRYVLKGRALGYVDKKFQEMVQAVYHYFTGHYLSLLKKKKTFVAFPALLFLGIINRSVRKIAWNFFKRALARPRLFFARASHQAITVVSPPHFVNGRRDLCDACPDAMFYRGELVPSCGLEEYRLYGGPFELAARPRRGKKK